VRIERRDQLVDRGRAGTDLVIAQPDQDLQLTQPGIHRFQTTQPMPVGAQVVGQLVAVSRVGLGARGAPPWAGGVERGGVHRHHGVARREQPVDHQTAVLLDDHREVS